MICCRYHLFIIRFLPQYLHNGLSISFFQLTFDGQTATLVMSEAFPKNAGTYTVVAKNSAGEAQCTANVSVKVIFSFSQSGNLDPSEKSIFFPENLCIYI